MTTTTKKTTTKNTKKTGAAKKPVAKPAEKPSEFQDDYVAIGAEISNRFIHAIGEAQAISEELKRLSKAQNLDEKSNGNNENIEKNIDEIIKENIEQDISDAIAKPIALDDKIKELWQHIENNELTEDITADFSIDDVIAVIKHDIALRKQQSNQTIGFVTPIDPRKTISQNLALKNKTKPAVNIAHQIEYLIRTKTGRYAENLLQLWMTATQNIH